MLEWQIGAARGRQAGRAVQGGQLQPALLPRGKSCESSGSTLATGWQHLLAVSCLPQPAGPRFGPPRCAAELHPVQPA